MQPMRASATCAFHFIHKLLFGSKTMTLYKNSIPLSAAFAFLWVMASSCFSAAAAPVLDTKTDLTEVLEERIAQPHEETIAAYISTGATGTKSHNLTEAEWDMVKQSIADLPLLHQQVLKQYLSRLSFIDAPESAGTALTRSFKDTDGTLKFDITIRADIMKISLGDFLTLKEQRLFTEDESGQSVIVSTGDMNALTYLLLHEATHVIDRSRGITLDGGPFRSLWADYRTLKDPYPSQPIGNSPYRRGPKLANAQSISLYQALKNSPFVSLYSSASAGEDFAELVTWRVLSTQYNMPLSFQVVDRHGKPVITVEPLQSTQVLNRFQAVDAILNVQPN